MIRSAGRPTASAWRALSRAELTRASYMMAWALKGTGRLALASMIRARSSWSRLPQLTPMRTGLPWRQAVSTMLANWTSRSSPRPTLPGLMRYLERAWAHSG